MVNIVPKGSPDTSRQALLEAFVDAHFDGETGASLCDPSGFYSVLIRLGRKDLDFGVEARALGALNKDEERRAREMYAILRREAPEQRKGAPLMLSRDHTRTSPFYKLLSTAQRLVFEALDRSGTRVIQPAVATTLAQAMLEGWFDVPPLAVFAGELLKQSSEQGDAHAAYLLATVRTPEGAYLDESEDRRQSYLEHAKRQGHRHADDELQQRALEEMEEGRDFSDEDELAECKIQIQHALKVGPHREGYRLFDIAIELIEANHSYLACCTPDRFDVSTYRRHREQALEWIKKAAETVARARHWIASDSMSMYGREADRLSWLTRAAQPESGVKPFHPALVDMAEIYADRGKAIFDLVEARKCLAQALEKIAAPDAEIAIRMADLDEQLNEGQSFSSALELYAGASKSSAYAGFRAGLLALRLASTDDEILDSLSHFKACLSSKSGSRCARNSEAQRYAEVVIAIGWGGWKDGDEAWDEAAVILVQQVHEQRYRPDLESVWLRETDIQKLFDRNPQYVTYKEWVQGGMEGEKVREKFGEHFVLEHREEGRDSRLKFLEKRHYGFGAYDPLSFLKGIIAVSTRSDVLVAQLKRDYQMDRPSILSEFLFGQLHLHDRLGEKMEAVALGHFEHARKLISQRQDEGGGQGVSNRAKLLRWLEENTLAGILNSQPGVRRMVLTKELNGPVSEFGTSMMGQILKRFPKNELPGTSKAIEVRYRDRYINTPLKVALLVHWMAALKKYFESNKRWAIKCVTIETTDDMAIGGNGTFNQSWEMHYARNGVLWAALDDCGMRLDIPKVFVPHDRDLQVVFEDGSELQLDLGHGLSCWIAVPGGEASINDFDFRCNPTVQSKMLVQGKVIVGSVDELTNCWVEWRQARSHG